MDKKVQYGVIHEVGEYSPVVPLSEEDNDLINETDNNNTDDNQ